MAARSYAPDIIADIRFHTTGEGGRREPTVATRFRCPLRYQGEFFDCVLLLEQIGPIIPGQRVTVPIRFLYPELIKDMLNLGESIELWDGRVIASGTVVEVCPDPDP